MAPNLALFTCRKTLKTIQNEIKQVLAKYVIKLKSVKSKMVKKNAKPTNQMEKSETIQALKNQKGIRMGYHVVRDLLTRLTLSWEAMPNHLHGPKCTSLRTASLQRFSTSSNISKSPFPC